MNELEKNELEKRERAICESLGWPLRSNLELLGECISGIATAKKLETPELAARYLQRAIRLASQQGETVDRIWFLDGSYMQVRPQSEARHRQTCHRCASTEGFIFVDKNTVQVCAHDRAPANQLPAARADLFEDGKQRHSVIVP